MHMVSLSREKVWLIVSLIFKKDGTAIQQNFFKLLAVSSHNETTTPFSYCPSMVFLPVWPHCTNARWNRCQKGLTPSTLENWRRPPGHPCTTWIKTIQQDLKSNNFSLNEATDVAQNHPLWRLMSMFGARYALLMVHATKKEKSSAGAQCLSVT